MSWAQNLHPLGCILVQDTFNFTSLSQGGQSVTKYNYYVLVLRTNKRISYSIFKIEINLKGKVCIPWNGTPLTAIQQSV